MISCQLSGGFKLSDSALYRLTDASDIWRRALTRTREA